MLFSTLSQPSFAAAAPDPSDYDTIQFLLEPHPIWDQVGYSTSTNSTAPLTHATFPFVDEAGQRWSIKVYFGAGGYDLFNASGALFTSGLLTPDQLTVFNKAALERRRSNKSPDVGYIQPVWIVAAIEIAIGLATLAIAYQTLMNAGEQAAADEAFQERQCLSDMARDRANALAQATASCPSGLQTGGCYYVVEFSRADPDICFGGGFERCQLVYSVEKLG